MEIVITGGGIVGQCTAMLLAKDGHAVTVLERDAAEPPEDPTAAWDGWDRGSVGQFKMLHFFLPRFTALAGKELPEVAPAFLAAGGLLSNPLRSAPPQVTGGFRDGDEAHDTITGRRPVFEAVVAKLAASTPGVTIRRGAAAAGLITGDEAMPGVPHVVGVRTEDGEEIRADLVVDMTGRRSPLPRWLDAIGARPPVEELEDCGFIYYGRHFRSEDGSIPLMLGQALQPYGSFSALCLPADNGTWGIGLITSAADPALRALKDADTWMRVVRSLPLAAHWVDAEPLDDKPAVMAKIEDRRRQFVVDGAPVATGVVAVGDSWACTNPSLGRGMSIGLTHAIALRDLLRTGAPEHPGKLALAWNDVTDATVLPWYQATLHFDRHRLAEIEAVIRGETYDPGDPVWEMTNALQCAAMRDPECLRGFLAIVGLVKTGSQLFSEPGFAERVIEQGSGWREAPLPGPDREQLLSIVAG